VLFTPLKSGFVSVFSELKYFLPLHPSHHGVEQVGLFGLGSGNFLVFLFMVIFCRKEALPQCGQTIFL
jgi:hypothetical protein